MSRSPLQYLVEPLLDAVDRLEHRVRGLPTLRLGTITGEHPLRVQLDGDTSPLPATPRTISPVSVGERVQAAHQGRVVTILGRIGGSGTMLLDEVTLPSGPIGQGQVLTVPPLVQGTFRRYRIEVSAGARSGSDLTIPLVIRINETGDTENYRYATIVRSVTDTSTSGTQVANESDKTAYPRTAYLGRYAGQVSITYAPLSLGNSGLVTWNSQGWLNSGGTGGSGGFILTGGGRWSISGTAPIESFQLRSSSLSSEWVSGNAQLWGER